MYPEHEPPKLQTRYRTWEIAVLVVAVALVMHFKRGWDEPIIYVSLVLFYLVVGGLFLNKLVLFEEYVLLKYPLVPFRNRKIELEQIQHAERVEVPLASGCEDYHIRLLSGKVIKFSTLFMRGFAPFQELFEKACHE